MPEKSQIISKLTPKHFFYIAFRVAFLRVFDILLDEFIATAPMAGRQGYLDRIPMLSGTAPHVQIELLFQTWNTLRTTEFPALTVEDQIICYAGTTELAETSSDNDQRTIRRAARGPVQIDIGNPMWLASHVRSFQVTLPFAPQAAALQMEPGIAADDLTNIREAGGVDSPTLNRLMNALSRWTVNSSLYLNAEGLLTDTETEILRAFFSEYPHLIRSTNG
jgi:hypothetical protein